MTTVACVWVKGNVPYTAEYVEHLAAMVAKWMDRQYRFLCLTDRVAQLPVGIIGVPIQSSAPLQGWWAKLRLHDTSLRLSGRILYLDLDTLIVAPLAPILDVPAAFATIPDGGSAFQPHNGTSVIKRFNSSVMVWDAGAGDRLWTDWSPKVAARLHGDQDWLAEVLPDAHTMPPEWFPRLSTFALSGQIPKGARVVLSKVPKNHVAAARWPWFDAIWRAA